jgi:hypothetical protein
MAMEPGFMEAVNFFLFFTKREEEIGWYFILQRKIKLLLLKNLANCAQPKSSDAGFW